MCYSISVQRLKTMAFTDKQFVGSKQVEGNWILEQVNNLNYMEYYRSFMRITYQPTTFKNIYGPTHKTVKNNARDEMLMSFCKVMVILIVVYGCETWVVSKEEGDIQIYGQNFKSIPLAK